jgi:hypothetical protein
MGRSFLIYTFFYCSALFSQFKPLKINQFYIGADLSQFTYIKHSAFNAGIAAQYKPFYFLSLNSALGYNNVSRFRAVKYRNMVEYNSRGGFLKLGFDLSLRLSKENRNNRIFIGFQTMLIDFKESGRFEIKNYWDTVSIPFKAEPRVAIANEIIFGFQASYKRWLIRPQFYVTLENDDKRVSYNDKASMGYFDKFLTGYRSPFIPGFGFRRGGLNMLVMYLW